MSSALVKQALDFVDPEETTKGKNKKKGSSGQGRRTQFKKAKKPQQFKPKEDIAEENAKKLLKLSQKVANDRIAEKIIERAVKGKPLTNFIEVKKAEEEKSILFPDGDDTLKEYFRN